MECDNCESERVLSISVKNSDRFYGTINGVEYRGYTPDIPPIGSDDYTDPDICLDCGKVQGDFPVDTPEEFTEKILECSSCGDKVAGYKGKEGQKCRWHAYGPKECDGTYQRVEGP